MSNPVLAYFVRHWRGELQLALVWWVNCVALTFALGPAIGWLTEIGGFAAADTARHFTAVLLLSTLQIAVVPLWQMVGLWRAAEHHMAYRGTILAARATQVLAVLFTLLITVRALVFAGEQLISARVAYALGPYHYTVALLSSGHEIEVSGGLGYGVTDQVEQILARSAGIRRIRLNSGGGSLLEAVRLREVIVRHQLDTYTDRDCSSACISAYIGGRFRFMRRGARMGFHLPRNWELLSTGPLAAGYAPEVGYFLRRGVPGWFVADWLHTGQKFWFPTELQLVRAGIVTFMRGPPPPVPARHRPR